MYAVSQISQPCKRRGDVWIGDCRWFYVDNHSVNVLIIALCLPRRNGTFAIALTTTCCLVVVACWLLPLLVVVLVSQLRLANCWYLLVATAVAR